MLVYELGNGVFVRPKRYKVNFIGTLNIFFLTIIYFELNI